MTATADTIDLAGVNKTLAFEDARDPRIAPTVADMKRWARGWRLKGEPLGVNGYVKKRWYVRRHKMWEYSRGLALTAASGPTRSPGGPLHVLDVGGAMTLPILYLASLGDRVVCLDIDPTMTEQSNAAAARQGLDLHARMDNLGEVDPSAADLGAPESGFDRVYCFSVIEHILPPQQERVASRMGRLVRPGGMLCVTFDFGEDGPMEAPMRTMEDAHRLADLIGLPLVGGPFSDTGERFALNRKHPAARYTFGSMFFRRPAD
ncbi:MAG: class I SAM-dependent methyltransferase [Planctomycetota bacterium]